MVLYCIQAHPYLHLICTEKILPLVEIKAPWSTVELLVAKANHRLTFAHNFIIVDIIDKLQVPLRITPHVQLHDMFIQAVFDVSRHSVIDVKLQVCKIMMSALHLATCSRHMYHQCPVAIN